MMGKLLKKVKNFLENPIISSSIKSFRNTFIISVLAVIVLLLSDLFGFYSAMARRLDLKYNSPLVLGPLIGAFIAAGIAIIVGSIIYFHKYTRPTKKTFKRSKFAVAFKDILNRS